MTKPLEALIARKGNSVTGNYYLAKCEICEEMFTSERMTGGEPIADTGDYGDCYCPHCGTDDSGIADYGNNAAEAWNFQQKHIDALIAALEQKDKRIAELEVSETQLITERDNAEEALADMYQRLQTRGQNGVTTSDLLMQLKL